GPGGKGRRPVDRGSRHADRGPDPALLPLQPDEGRPRGKGVRMSAPLEAVLAELGPLFGPRLATGAALRAQHANTLMWTASQPPDAVIYPESTEEVSAIARCCFAHGVAMIPFGAGSSFEGQVNAPRGGISIDTSRMNACLSV